MMEEILKYTGLGFALAVAIVLIAIIGAYPVMWCVNYLVNPDFLARIFTTTHFGFWHAFALNYLSASLIKSTLTSTK